jgi:uncharacterized membrane protein (UPF0127 family)
VTSGRGNPGPGGRAHDDGDDGRFGSARAGDRRERLPRLADAARAAALAALLAAAAACGGGEDAGAGEPGASAETPRDEAPARTRQEADSADGPAPGDDGERPLTTLDVAGHEVEVEIADDEEERRRGLMHRDSLPEDRGMLFVYSEEQTLSFYMRNTEIPLDIAFLDRRGYIVDVQQMEPHSDELHRSSRPAMYALEMNRGWFEAHGVGEGDRVRF